MRFKGSTRLGSILLCGFAMPLVCADVHSASADEVWAQATASAGWSKRLRHVSVVFNSRMWVLGGQVNGGQTNDVWYSTDGAVWTQVTAAAPWAGRLYHSGLTYGGRMWILGGVDGGNHRDAWYSTDGASWVQATATAGWSARYGFPTVDFDGRVWMTGGYDSGRRGDVWHSVDGATWTLATLNAPWTARDAHRSLAFAGRLWILGGAFGGYLGDVWSTTNGVNWTQATSLASWGTRSQHVAVVRDGRMWVAGGAAGSTAYNDVWTSTDGASWTQVTSAAAWSGRNAATSVVSNNVIWIMGGSGSDGLVNDVWYTAPDSDGDTIADPADLCPGFDDRLDADSDRIPDGCDACPGYDDNLDCNASGTADGCDIDMATSDDCNSSGVPDECEAGQWDGPNGGSFTAAANWDPDSVPTTLAILSNTGSVDNRCVLDAPGITGICGLTIEAVGSGRQILLVFDGSVLNAASGMTIGTGGTIELQGGDLSGGDIVNTSNTFQGSGSIDASVVNSGLVKGTYLGPLVFRGDAFVNESEGTVWAPLASIVGVQSPTTIQQGLIDVRANATVIFDRQLVNESGAEIRLLGGAIGAAGIENAAGGGIEGTGTIDSDLLNEGDMTLIADTLVVGDLQNDGTIVIQGGLLTVTGDLYGSGAVIGGFGGRDGNPVGLTIRSDLDLSATNPSLVDLSTCTVQFDGAQGGIQGCEVMSPDIGPIAGRNLGVHAFAIGTLRVGPSATTVRLLDRHDNKSVGSCSRRTREAMYVRHLILDPGVTLDLGGLRLYYETAAPENPTNPDSGVAIVDTIGGGELIWLMRHQGR